MAKKKTYAAVMDDMSKKLRTYENRLQEAQQRGDAVGMQDYERRVQRVKAGIETLFQTQEASKKPQMSMGGMLKKFGPGGLTQQGYLDYKYLKSLVNTEITPEESARLKDLQTQVDAATKLGWNPDFGFNPDGSLASRPMAAAESVTDAPPQEPYTGPSITPQQALDNIGRAGQPSFNQGPDGPYAANEITTRPVPGAPVTQAPAVTGTPTADPRRVPVGSQAGAQNQQPTIRTSGPRNIPADGSYPGAAVNDKGEYMIVTDPSSGQDILLTPDMVKDSDNGSYGQRLRLGNYSDQMIFFDPDSYKGASRTLTDGAQYTNNTTFSSPLPEPEIPTETTVNPGIGLDQFAQAMNEQIMAGAASPSQPNATTSGATTVGDVTGIGETQPESTTPAPLTPAGQETPTPQLQQRSTEDTTSTAAVDPEGNAITPTGNTGDTSSFIQSLMGQRNPVAQYGQFLPDLYAAYQMEKVKGPADLPTQTIARRNTDVDYNPVYAQARQQQAQQNAMIDRNISNPVVAAAMKRSAANQAQQMMGQTRSQEINQERELQNQYASEIAQNQNVNRQIQAQNQQRNIDFQNERRAARARMLQQAGQKFGQIYGEEQNRQLDEKRLGISALAYEGDLVQRMAQRYPELEALISGR